MGDTTVLVRMSPYRTAENQIDGLLIAFVDVDELMRSLRAAGIPVFVRAAPESPDAADGVKVERSAG
jgi:hypothetical protein